MRLVSVCVCVQYHWLWTSGKVVVEVFSGAQKFENTTYNNGVFFTPNSLHKVRSEEFFLFLFFSKNQWKQIFYSQCNAIGIFLFTGVWSFQVRAPSGILEELLQLIIQHTTMLPWQNVHSNHSFTQSSLQFPFFDELLSPTMMYAELLTHCLQSTQMDHFKQQTLQF